MSNLAPEPLTEEQRPRLDQALIRPDGGLTVLGQWTKAVTHEIDTGSFSDSQERRSNFENELSQKYRPMFDQLWDSSQVFQTEKGEEKKDLEWVERGRALLSHWGPNSTREQANAFGINGKTNIQQISKAMKYALEQVNETERKERRDIRDEEKLEFVKQIGAVSLMLQEKHPEWIDSDGPSADYGLADDLYFAVYGTERDGSYGKAKKHDWGKHMGDLSPERISSSVSLLMDCAVAAGWLDRTELKTVIGLENVRGNKIDIDVGRLISDKFGDHEAERLADSRIVNLFVDRQVREKIAKGETEDTRPAVNSVVDISGRENESSVGQILREQFEIGDTIRKKRQEVQQVYDQAEVVMKAAKRDLGKLADAQTTHEQIDSMMESYQATQRDVALVAGERRRLFGDASPPDNFDYGVLMLDTEYSYDKENIRILAREIDYVPQLYGIQVDDPAYIVLRERMAIVVANIDSGMFDDDREAQRKVQKVIQQYLEGNPAKNLPAGLTHEQLLAGRNRLATLQKPLPEKQEPDAEELKQIADIRADVAAQLGKLETKTPITIAPAPIT